MHIKGIFIILTFLLLGNACSYAMSGFLPGSVMGMVLLFLALLTGIVKAKDIRKVAEFLTKNMTLFFLPAAIGIMEEWGMIRLHLGAWIVLLIVPTVCVLITVCKTQDTMMSLIERFKRREK